MGVWAICVICPPGVTVPSAEEGLWFFLPKLSPGREKSERRGEEGTEEGGEAAGDVIFRSSSGVLWYVWEKVGYTRC